MSSPCARSMGGVRVGETVWPSDITEDPESPSRALSMDLIEDLAAWLTNSLLPVTSPVCTVPSVHLPERTVTGPVAHLSV